MRIISGGWVPNPITRRDFLKLAALTAGTGVLNRLAPVSPQPPADNPSVLILIFDAMSARHLSLYGYHRETTPNLTRFAEQALVYHNHHSPGSFTSPGTASLLTGTLPWTHRALNMTGMVARHLVDRNMFNLFSKTYHRFAYTQNVWANYILGQFKSDIDTLLPPESFSVVDEMVGSRLGALPKTYRAFDDFLFRDGSPPASLLFGLGHRIQLHRREARAARQAYPRGLPRAGDYPIFFDNREVYDGVLEIIRSLPSPYLAYLHLWAPHDPYKPSAAFDNYFKDTWAPPVKPRHRLGGNILPGRQFSKRKNYDEYIAEVDFEFGRLMDILYEEQHLANTIVMVTSDHGEMLERGEEGHITRLMYEPLVNIPLLVSLPNQTRRLDIHTPTNAIDVLPSLLHQTGHHIPDWCEGQVLPGFEAQAGSILSSLMMDAKDNPAYAPLKEATLAIRRDNFKLIYYTGYEAEDSFELYDLEADPEELTDLYPSQPALVVSLKDELLDAFDTANKWME